MSESEDTSILHEDNSLNDEIVCNPTVQEIGTSEKDLEQYCLDLKRFIRSSNLNKKLTNSLFKLVNSTSSNKSLPQNEKQLWEQLDIKFEYKSIIYCTNCMKQLLNFSDRCDTCSNIYSGITQ